MFDDQIASSSCGHQTRTPFICKIFHHKHINHAIIFIPFRHIHFLLFQTDIQKNIQNKPFSSVIILIHFGSPNCEWFLKATDVSSCRQLHQLRRGSLLTLTQVLLCNWSHGRCLSTADVCQQQFSEWVRLPSILALSPTETWERKV